MSARAPSPRAKRAASDRELDAVLKALASISERAAAIARVLPDVHVLAYDRQNQGEALGTAHQRPSPPVARKDRRDAKDTSSFPGWYLDEQGMAMARDVLKAIYRSVLDADTTLGRHNAKVRLLFSGPGADNTLRGTLLGEVDPDTNQIIPGSPAKELNEARQAQKRRAERGEYTPSRSEVQPQPVWRGK